MHPNYKLSEEIVNKILASYNEEMLEIAAKELGVEDSIFSKCLAFSMCLLSEILASLPDKILRITHDIFSHTENKEVMIQIFQKTVTGINKLEKEPVPPKEEK